MTGVFPFFNGSCGLTQGKDAMKRILQEHGAKVVGSVSKRCTLVMCGNEPGSRKLLDGLKVGAKLIGIQGLRDMLTRSETIRPAVVESLSTGYRGNAVHRIGCDIDSINAKIAAKRIKLSEPADE